MLAVTAAGSLAAPVLIGMLDTSPARAQHPSRSFEVASIRASSPDLRGVRLNVMPGGGLRAQGVTLKALIEFAYDVPEFQISGAPAWWRTERFDIIAKPDSNTESAGQSPPPAPASKLQWDEVRERTRGLLASRFQLVMRMEKAERPAYALTTVRTGHKLQPNPAGGNGISRNRGSIHGDGAELGLLLRVLTTTLGRPVLDNTGLAGKYNFKLEWADEPGALGKDLPNGDSVAAGASGPSIFTALKEQLGLELQPTRSMADIYIIERLEKPTEN
jgi:uncharacterized protein (TIGR03435 family)